MVSLCVLTGRDWIEGASPRPDPAQLRRRSLVNLSLVFAQIVLGAWLRHFPSNSALVAHAVIAAAVISHAVALAWRAERRKREFSELVPSARAMALVVALQVVLGVASWWMLRPFDGIPRTVTIVQAMVRTGHQANAALLLASAVVLSLRACRHLIRSIPPERVRVSALDLEVVA
jgi:cytochrome c oxidase assembly protein subunit 15